MTSPLRSLVARAASPALGGVAAQGSQAVASFVLQFLTAQVIGLEALGTFAVVYTLIVLATAISTGFVGDSLTVLDRTDPSIRTALVSWATGIAAAAGVVFAGVSAAVGFLDASEAVWFGLASGAFVVEDLVRRLLMATLHFWRIVAVDLAALGGALVVFAVVADLRFVHILVALTAGQLVGFVVGVVLLPGAERAAIGWTGGGMRAVASFGVWRALQQAVRAGTMAAMRILLLFVTTATAVGGLELARIYMAPAALCVAGISSFLFASYAASTGTLSEKLAIADRAVVRLLAAVGAVGLVAVALVPLLGPLFTPDDTSSGDAAGDLSVLAVAGWAVLAATTAAVTPYGQLAAVGGRQREVFSVRLVESVVGLVAMTAVVDVTDSVEWAPAVLAACAIPAGLAIRRFFIVADIDDPGVTTSC